MPKRRSKTIVVTDRYCSDLLLMKYVPLSLKKALLSLFPKPTLTFYLYQDPEILHQRRPQETVEELQRQLSLFAELKRNLQPIEIKTRDVEKDVALVITTVLTYLYQKWY
jgi:thymidylate kinase